MSAAVSCSRGMYVTLLGLQHARRPSEDGWLCPSHRVVGDLWATQMLFECLSSGHQAVRACQRTLFPAHQQRLLLDVLLVQGLLHSLPAGVRHIKSAGGGSRLASAGQHVHARGRAIQSATGGKGQALCVAAAVVTAAFC